MRPKHLGRLRIMDAVTFLYCYPKAIETAEGQAEVADALAKLAAELKLHPPIELRADDQGHVTVPHIALNEDLGGDGSGRAQIGPSGRYSCRPTPSDSAPGRSRTCDTRLRRSVLYPLSYRGGGSIIPRSGVGTELEQIWPPESPSVPFCPLGIGIIKRPPRGQAKLGLDK